MNSPPFLPLSRTLLLAFIATLGLAASGASAETAQEAELELKKEAAAEWEAFSKQPEKLERSFDRTLAARAEAVATQSLNESMRTLAAAHDARLRDLGQSKARIDLQLAKLSMLPGRQYDVQASDRSSDRSGRIVITAIPTDSFPAAFAP